jgi:hypothetical protein
MFQTAEIMDEMEYMDLSFLEKPGALEEFVDDLFAFHCLMMRNEDESMIVIKMLTPDQLIADMSSLMEPGAETVDIVVPNGKTDPLCPFFKVVMNGYSNIGPLNYKLETFFRATGILGVHARCRMALVVGMMNKDYSNSLVDIPEEYHTLPVRPIDMYGPIDLYSHQSVMRNRCLEHLMNIPGMELPAELPPPIHWNIMKYLRHPCAEMILTHRERMLVWLSYWDHHFDVLFNSPSAW